MTIPCAYPMTRSLQYWLRDTFLPVEQTVFDNFCNVRSLTKMVQRCEAGHISHFAVKQAIKQYNREQGTHWTYEGLRDSVAPSMLMPAGEWCLHTLRPDIIMRATSGDIDEVVHYAPRELQWALMEVPSLGVLFTLRTPIKGRRGDLEHEEFRFLGGLYRGATQGYVLPREVERAILADKPPMIDRLLAELEQSA